MNQEEIGKFIFVLRKEKNMTQEQFGECLGVSQRTVSRWETGKNMPDISMLQPISELLGCSVTELLQGKRIGEAVSEKEVSGMVTSLIDMAVKKRRIKEIVGAVVSVVITLVCMILLYNYEFSLDITSTADLERAIDEYHFAEEIQSDVLERAAIGSYLIVLYKEQKSEINGGIAQLERGIFGKYRIISASDFQRPLYHAETIDIRKKRYLLVYTITGTPEASSMEVVDYTGVPVYTLEVGTSPSLTVVETDSGTMVSPWDGIHYYDQDGQELSEADLREAFTWDENGGSSGYGTAELGMVYVLEGILFLLGLMFVRYFLSKKETL